MEYRYKIILLQNYVYTHTRAFARMHTLSLPLIVKLSSRSTVQI